MILSRRRWRGGRAWGDYRRLGCGDGGWGDQVAGAKACGQEADALAGFC